MSLYPERPRSEVCCLQHVAFRAFAHATWLPKDSDPSHAWKGLLQQLKTLADQVQADPGQPCDIAAWSRKAAHEPVRYRIGSASEDNGDGPRCLLGGQGAQRGRSHDDIHLEGDKLRGERRESLELPLGIPDFDYDVAALDVSKIAQSLAEGVCRAQAAGHAARQVANARDPGRPLRIGGGRRRPECKQREYGFTPVHVDPSTGQLDN